MSKFLLQKIKFVYFDVGGVVIKDFSGTDKWQQMMTGLGVTKDKQAIFTEVFHRFGDEIATFRHVDTLIPIIEKECNIKIPSGYSLQTDFISRFKPNPSIHPVIKKIRKTCRIGLLTDVYPGMFEETGRHGLLPEIKWDVIIKSCEVGFRKPDPKIFDIAQEKCGYKGKEILFVENTLKNIEGAAEYGWQTFFYDSSNVDLSNAKLERIFQLPASDI